MTIKRAVLLMGVGLLGAACDSPTLPEPLPTGTFRLSTTGQYYGAELTGTATTGLLGNPGTESSRFQITLEDPEPRLPRSHPRYRSIITLKSLWQPPVGQYRLVPWGTQGRLGGTPAADEVIASWAIVLGSSSYLALTPLRGMLRITESSAARVVGEIDGEFVQDFWLEPQELSVVRGRFTAAVTP